MPRHQHNSRDVLLLACLPLLLADDSDVIRKAVRRLLETELAIRVIGEATDFAEAIQKVSELKRDVLLRDLHMPDKRSFDAEYVKTHLRPIGSDIKIIGTSLPGDDDEARDLAASLGASTVLLKNPAFITN